MVESKNKLMGFIEEHFMDFLFVWGCAAFFMAGKLCGYNECVKAVLKASVTR